MESVTANDPEPYDYEDYFNNWLVDAPVEEIKNHREAIADTFYEFSRPFMAQGYNTMAAVNRGLAAFSVHMDSITKFLEMSGFGERGGLFEDAAEIYNKNADYWRDRADKVGINFVDEIISEAVGQAVPGIATFSLDVASGYTFPFMSGYAEGEETGLNPIANGLLSSAKTGTLHGLFKMINPLKQYLRAPTMGTIFGLEEQAYAPEGQKEKAFVKGFATGAGYSLTSPGGRLGLNDVIEGINSELPARMRNERGAIEIGKPDKNLTKIAYDELINGITREAAGDMLKMGDKRVLAHIKEGIKKHGIMPMEDAIKNQIMKEVASTKKGSRERNLVLKRIQKLEPEINKIFQESRIPVSPESPILQGQTKQRKFLKTASDSHRTDPITAEKIKEIDPQEYVVQPNAESLGNAVGIIKDKGIDGAREFVLSESPLNADKSATFITLMDTYQKLGDFDRAVEMTEAYDMQLREAGRFIQAASLWSRGTPQAFIRWGNKQLEKVRDKYSWADTLLKRKPESFTLSTEEQKEIIELHKRANELPEGPERSDLTLQMIDVVARKVPPSIHEMFDAYRYSNMLSGPRTQERNIGENLFNTFVTRPFDLTLLAGVDFVKSTYTGKDREFYIRDVPLYYKTAINAVPNAVQGFVNTWKQKNFTTLEKPEIGIEVRNAFEQARMKQMPDSLMMVARFMEASDKFNIALISAGEMARLLENGVPEGKAYAQSQKTANTYLYRDKLDSKNPELSYPGRALASLGSVVNWSRKQPVLGKVSQWFIPFIRTPINKGIQMVQRSPLGWLRDPKTFADTEIAAKALGGAIVTGIGTVLAMTNETTWTPPSNEEEKKLFYATGRKPFSINFGETWVPLWYFGPFALSMAFPIAYKHYFKERPEAVTDDTIDKMIGISEGLARFVGSQSSTQSIGVFFSMLAGDIDYKSTNQIGFMSQQVIPGSAFVRYVNTIIDPVYRKPDGYWESVLANLPILSQDLEPRLGPDEEIQRRDTRNYFLPYDLGTADTTYEEDYQELREEQRDRRLDREFNKFMNSLRDPIKPEDTFEKFYNIFKLEDKK